MRITAKLGVATPQNSSISQLKSAFLLICALALPGCASFARGVTQAILDTDDQVEDRLCRIDGAGFSGLEEVISEGPAADSTHTMRMLIVHGIGPHSENYAEPFVRSVAKELGLPVRDANQKRIRLGRAKLDRLGVGAYGGDQLGWLNVTRYTNVSGSRELLTFEVLWSGYNEDARQKLLAFDKDTAKLRASINDTVKTFFNQQVIDPVKYLGDNARDVRGHVRQASCWMLSGDWEDYPSSQSLDDDAFSPCPLIESLSTISGPAKQKAADIAANDAFVAVTHSLGSRIFLDAFSIQGDEKPGEINPFFQIGGLLSQRDVTLIMLANQLPLLQQGLNDEAGFSFADVPWKNAARYNGDYARYNYNKYESKEALCSDTDLVRSQRRFKKLSLVSVSDPNDLLSYRILVGDFANDYLDWALCPSVTEVLMSVSAPRSVFGVEFADPSKAHNGYWTDGGLSRLLVQGFGGDAGDVRIATDKRGAPADWDDENAKVRYNCDGTVYR